MMSKHYKILILGASYGSLLATKMLMGGHDVALVCLPAEAELINREGIRVRIPVKGREGLVEVDSRKLPGKISGLSPQDADPKAYDLVALAMQEPQYRAEGVRQLVDRIATSGKPCMSIMNMPPLPYLARIPGIDAKELHHCFTDATVWQNFDPHNMTLCSPDPQAFRPPEEPTNILQVSLPTNFKVAKFNNPAFDQILTDLQHDIEAARFDAGDGPIELPVKLKVHDSVFVPLAKWAMLLTGNYRCIQANEMRPIKEAVHSDLAASKAIYAWVNALCVKLGANPDDLVPFEKYANAAQGLAKPSSAARALAAGAQNIERVDLVVQTMARLKGDHSDSVDQTVKLVNSWLEKNRSKA
jgi:hypothetical protein